VYSQRWSETDAPRALGAYCFYILLLAVNGILEAFVHAVAKSRCAPSALPPTLYFSQTAALLRPFWIFKIVL
jgi:oligosaccharide translocation protein RFT1